MKQIKSNLNPSPPLIFVHVFRRFRWFIGDKDPIRVLIVGRKEFLTPMTKSCIWIFDSEKGRSLSREIETRSLSILKIWKLIFFKRKDELLLLPKNRHIRCKKCSSYCSTSWIFKVLSSSQKEIKNNLSKKGAMDLKIIPEVLELSPVVLPALAMDMVCCSMASWMATLNHIKMNLSELRNYDDVKGKRVVSRSILV